MNNPLTTESDDFLNFQSSLLHSAKKRNKQKVQKLMGQRQTEFNFCLHGPSQPATQELNASSGDLKYNLLFSMSQN